MIGFPERTGTLAELGARVQADNPTLQIVTDDAGVWIRQDGRDYGLYATIVTGGPVVLVYDRDTGRTAMTRPVPP